MELIVVIAIIGIIAAYVVPQAAGILKGSTLTQASTIVTDQIRLAREVALTKNCQVEVRFYQYGDPEVPGENVNDPTTGQYRAIQVFQVMNAGTANTAVSVPLDKVQMFPQGVVMNSSATYSTLLNIPGVANTTSPNKGASEPTGLQLPRGIKSNYNYISFKYLPDGSTNLPVTGVPPAFPAFLTLHNANDVGFLNGGIPYNYFCIQIDPVAGTTKAYRPTAG